MDTLNGKVAVVTGVARGIGRAIVERLARKEAAVVVNYASSADEANEEVATIDSFGGRALPVQADIARLDDIRRLFREATERFGRLVVLVLIGLLFITISTSTAHAQPAGATSQTTPLSSQSLRGGTQTTIPVGTAITMQNWQRYRQFMPDGMIALFEGKYFWNMPQDVEIEVGSTIIHPLPKGYDEDTDKYAAQVRIIHKPDGKTTIVGYQGGQPFPHPSGPDKGWEILANLWFRYVPHLVVNTKGAICRQDHYGNASCNTVKLVYRQLNYNTDPGTAVATPGADTEYMTEWVMTLTPESEKYRTTLTVSYNDITKPQDVYVFIPALRRYQPVAAGARCSSVGGTDATLDDFRFGFNGLIGDFGATFLGERRLLALTDYDLPQTDFPNDFDMPLGWPKPSWGRWQLRDVDVVDVRKIPSEASGYCYGKRVIYIDRQFHAPMWEELYDTSMHLWKIMAVFTHTLDVPQIGPVNSNYSQVEDIWDLKNDHATYYIDPAEGQPFYLNQEAPKEYDSVVKYSTPGGLGQIMR